MNKFIMMWPRTGHNRVMFTGMWWASTCQVTFPTRVGECDQSRVTDLYKPMFEEAQSVRPRSLTESIHPALVDSTQVPSDGYT